MIVAKNKQDSRCVREAFSRAAGRYDRLSSLHREVGRKLIARLPVPNSFARVLDVGMGTGWLTQQITARYPHADVWGLDFSEGMVTCAKNQHKGFHVVQADATALPFRPAMFDGVTSNLAYQWVDDLTRAFQQVQDALKPGGTFCFTLFGPGTFKEMFSSLRQFLGDLPSLNRKLPEKSYVYAALEKSGLLSPEVQTENITLEYPDMFALMKWIKDIGANRAGNNVYIGRGALRQAGTYYREHYGNGKEDDAGVRATFEIIWGKGIKR